MAEQPTVAIRARLLSYAGIGLGLFAIWFFVLGGNGDSSAPKPERRTAESYAAEYGGGAGRYQAVLRLTDCTDLGRMFSDGKANFDNHAPGGRDLWLGQMAVTDDRMDALGCQ